MPPKVKISKQDIIQTAVDLIRKSGEDSVNARSIATALNCSTQPIFSNFSSMEELQEEVIYSAYCLYTEFLQEECKSSKYPKYKAFGMAYIRFAGEERELFKLLFMRDRSGGESMDFSPDFDQSVQMIMHANSITEEKARLIHLEMWIFVHGIATMLATSFLSLEWDLVSDMLTDAYKGIIARHTSEENENDRN